MLKFTDIDFNTVWQETFGWNAAGDTDNRKFNDQAENDFWVRLAPRYTQVYNLNHDTGLIADTDAFSSETYDRSHILFFILCSCSLLLRSYKMIFFGHFSAQRPHFVHFS